MIIVTGSVTAKPESLEALRQASIEHVHRSLAEDGCLYHSVQADCEDPLRLVFFERWRDMAALKVHFGVAGTREFMAAIREHAASTAPIETYEATEVKP